jgi:fructokinase
VANDSLANRPACPFYWFNWRITLFLCCGDALFDMFSTPTEQPGSVALQGLVGGSPMNVASGLARLGHQSGYFTKLSSDMFGVRMRDWLVASNIDISLSLNTDLNTTLAIVELADDGSARYVFYTSNTADVSIVKSELPSTLSSDIKLLHFGSYSTAVEPTASTLAHFARVESTSRVISYDPNLRPSIEPDIDKWREMFGQFAASANVIKASDEDIETLLGKNREDHFVADCFAKGAQLVFITRGPDGASGFKPDGASVHAEGVSVDVVDTVGAGDTFQAATLHWLGSNGHLGAGVITGDVDLQASMSFAIRAAAVTCTRKGADLPTLADLQ